MVCKSLLTVSAGLIWADKNVHKPHRTPSIELKHQHVAKQPPACCWIKENVLYTSVDVRSVNDVILFDLDMAGRKKAWQGWAYPCQSH